MLDFKQAIENAKKNLLDIQKSADGISVEQAVINDQEHLYEITLSYKVLDKDTPSDTQIPPSLAAMYAMSSFGRKYQTFLIDKRDGSFKGFKIFKEA